MLISKEHFLEKKIQIRTRISPAIYEELGAYMQWADISSRDFFIEEACSYIFKNDSAWINYKKKTKSWDMS